MNKQIVSSAALITATGIISAISGGHGLTRVFLGGYIFLAMLAILDMFGGRASQLAGAFAIIAALFVLINEATPVWNAIGSALGIKL